MRRPGSCALLLGATVLAIGCEVDVQLGVRPSAAVAIDGGVSGDDASEREPPLDAGALDAGRGDAAFAGTPYYLGIHISGDGTGIMCAEGLAGQEQAFAFLTPEGLGLEPGLVGLEVRGDTLRLTGAPIRSAYGVDELVLRQNAFPDQPIDSYIGLASGSQAIGPAGTTHTTSLFFLDSLASLSGAAGFEFTDLARPGTCMVSFAVTLAPQ